jgi:hypothetical protein
VAVLFDPLKIAGFRLEKALKSLQTFLLSSIGMNVDMVFS